MAHWYADEQRRRYALEFVCVYIPPPTHKRKKEKGLDFKSAATTPTEQNQKPKGIAKSAVTIYKLWQRARDDAFLFHGRPWMRTTIEQKQNKTTTTNSCFCQKKTKQCVCAYKNECGRRRFLSHKKEGPAVGRKINQEWWTDLSRVIDDSRRVPLLWLDSTHDTSTTSFSLFFLCDYLSRFFLVWFSFDFVDEQYFCLPNWIVIVAAAVEHSKRFPTRRLARAFSNRLSRSPIHWIGQIE